MAGLGRKRIGIIVGDAHIGVLASALKIAIETAKTCDVIIVGNADIMDVRIDGVHASMASILPEEISNKAFEKPPIPIKNFRTEAHDEDLKPHLLKEANPWPSPKGRNGKRKW